MEESVSKLTAHLYLQRVNILLICLLILPFNRNFLGVCFSTPMFITEWFPWKNLVGVPLKDECHCDLGKLFLRGIHTCAFYSALVKILAHPSSRCLEEKSLFHTELLNLYIFCCKKNVLLHIIRKQE